ncbi:MAG: MIP family channel protein [Oscillospiraceae bacterium]
MDNIKKYIAEFLGTAMLVIFGCGSACTNGFGAGYVGTALAFGLIIIAMAYSFGNISGCHVNPAVSIGMLINKRISFIDFIGYILAQFLGGIAGAGVLDFITDGLTNPDGSKLGLGANGYGEYSAMGISQTQALVVEIILTFMFVFAVLGVTSRREYKAVSGLVIGFSLTVVHILGLPFTGTSVNPARSFGPALLGGVDAFNQVGVFIVGPVIGAILAGIVFKLIDIKPVEQPPVRRRRPPMPAQRVEEPTAKNPVQNDKKTEPKKIDTKAKKED